MCIFPQPQVDNTVAFLKTLSEGHLESLEVICSWDKKEVCDGT